MIGLILIYGLLVALGGIMGYVKARSQPSLISGLVSGALLLGAWWFGLRNPKGGLSFALVIAIALLVVFILRYRKTQTFMPAGLMAILSGVAGVVFAIGLLL